LEGGTLALVLFANRKNENRMMDLGGVDSSGSASTWPWIRSGKKQKSPHERMQQVEDGGVVV
jgi:hypothetical protein